MTDEFTVAAVGIGQLHARFADAVFRMDIDEFAQCFAETGVWKIAGMDLLGRAAIHEAASRLLTRCEKIHLIPGQPILDVAGTTAQGRQQMTETRQNARWARLHHLRGLSRSLRAGSWPLALRPPALGLQISRAV